MSTKGDLDYAHLEPQDDVATWTSTSHKAMLHPNFPPRMFKLLNFMLIGLISDPARVFKHM